MACWFSIVYGKHSPESKPPFSHGFLVVFLWCSHFPMGFPRFSYGFLIFLWFSHFPMGLPMMFPFPMASPWFSYVPTTSSHGFPMIFPYSHRVFLWFSVYRASSPDEHRDNTATGASGASGGCNATASWGKQLDDKANLQWAYLSEYIILGSSELTGKQIAYIWAYMSFFFNPDIWYLYMH